MTEYITTDCKTLGEFINKHYIGFNIKYGTASMDMDITNGIEVSIADNRKYGHGTTVNLYPFIKWSDGSYKPCHYWGTEYFVTLYRN